MQRSIAAQAAMRLAGGGGGGRSLVVNGHVDAIAYDSNGDGRPDAVLHVSDHVSDDVRRIP